MNSILKLLHAQGYRFASNRRGDPGAAGSVGGLIGVVIFVVVAVALVATIVTAVQINTSSWNFTGHAAAAILLGLIALVFIAGILVASWDMLTSRGAGI